jgi:hypothetical protein
MKTAEGKIFDNRPAEEVIDFLKSNTYNYYTVSPRDLQLITDDSWLYLRINLKQSKTLKLRTSFLKKLLRWHNLPNDLAEKLTEDLFLKMLNELLNKIKSREVSIKTENDEALTITSMLFTEFKDLEVYEFIKNLNIKSISRNDLMTRFYTEKKIEAAPVEGDFCGFGFDVVNSETGFSPLSFDHFILRYICRNGAAAPINIYDAKKYHYEETRKTLSQFLNEQMNNSQKSREKLILALKQSNDIAGITAKNTTITRLNYVLGNWKGNELMKGFDWSNSTYELFNFITHNAKTYKINERYQLERLAGEIILN